MILQTRRFGEIEIVDANILDFDEGLPGFPDDKRFVLLTEDDNPISFLQSIDDSDISFVVVDVAPIIAGYDPHVEASLLDSLGEFGSDGLMVYNICTIHEDLKKSTVNLKAPIIINETNKKGKQVVCNNDEYSIKAPMFTDDASEKGDAPC